MLVCDVWWVICVCLCVWFGWLRECVGVGRWVLMCVGMWVLMCVGMPSTFVGLYQFHTWKKIIFWEQVFSFISCISCKKCPNQTKVEREEKLGLNPNPL